MPGKRRKKAELTLRIRDVIIARGTRAMMREKGTKKSRHNGCLGKEEKSGAYAPHQGRNHRSRNSRTQDNEGLAQ